MSKQLTKKKKRDLMLPKDAPPEAMPELRSVFKQAIKATTDPDDVIYEALQYLRDNGSNEKDRERIVEKALLTLGFENDYSILEGIDEKYRPMTIELRRQLIKDFHCTTHAEKVLIDTIVSGYMRHLRCARAFNNCLAQGTTTPVLNGYLSIISKEMDRALRQQNTAYQMLVELKRPPLKVQVKAQNAFVAHNQQLNVGENSPPK